MEEKKSVRQYMDEALVYERAMSTASTIMSKLAQQRNENEKESKRNGEEPDKSYQLLIDALAEAKKRFRKESNRLWKLAEKDAEVPEYSVENLCNAIMRKAAEDYEAALCGGGSDGERLRIEKFAEIGAEDYTSVDFVAVLGRIRDTQPMFARMAKEHAKEIVEETKRNKKRNADNRKNTYRCPLCGGGLYAYGKCDHGVQQIRCTGCNLFESVKYHMKDYLD